MNAKKLAGEKAVEFVQDGMVLGLGTGSTVQFALEKLAARVREGLRIQGVPTSVRTEKASLELGIPLIPVEEVQEIDLTIDGADEIDVNFSLIKGGGGALLREKVVANMSKVEVIVVGKDKLVDQLGKKFLLPVEVLPFGWKQTAREIEKLGSSPHLRQTEDGTPLLSDNQHYILDCKFPGIPNPGELEAEIDRIPGVLETGLFVGLAHVLIVADEDGNVEVRERPRS